MTGLVDIRNQLRASALVDGGEAEAPRDARAGLGTYIDSTFPTVSAKNLGSGPHMGQQRPILTAYARSVVQQAAMPDEAERATLGMSDQDWRRLVRAPQEVNFSVLPLNLEDTELAVPILMTHVMDARAAEVWAAIEQRCTESMTDEGPKPTLNNQQGSLRKTEKQGSFDRLVFRPLHEVLAKEAALATGRTIVGLTILPSTEFAHQVKTKKLAYRCAVTGLQQGQQVPTVEDVNKKAAAGGGGGGGEAERVEYAVCDFCAVKLYYDDETTETVVAMAPLAHLWKATWLLRNMRQYVLNVWYAWLEHDDHLPEETLGNMSITTIVDFFMNKGMGKEMVEDLANTTDTLKDYLYRSGTPSDIFSNVYMRLRAILHYATAGPLPPP